MIRCFSVVALIMLFATNVFAQNEASKEKVVTASAYFAVGDAAIANQYLSDQEYKGPVVGGGVEFGAMYKKNRNLTWDLDITYLGSSYTPIAEEIAIGNPARTSFYVLNSVDVDYGTYYNWNPVGNLYFKAGGAFNLLGGIINAVPQHINNSLDIDAQAQLKATLGVKYAMYFNKFGLSLQADITAPFLGLALSSSQYEAAIDSIIGGEILGGTTTPVYFTSLQNLKSLNSEIELDLIFKKATIFYTFEFSNRSWNLSGLQNYRNYSLNRIGLKVDLVSRNRLNSSNRYF